MISTNPVPASSPEPHAAAPVSFRRAALGKAPEVFTDIYQEETNIVIWQRELSTVIQDSTNDFLVSNPTFQAAMAVSPQDAFASVSESLGTASKPELSEDIAELVDMFCCLFGLKRAGLRLTVLDRAMCPRFHVDKVPCRLITTYLGVATEWLSHQAVDRTKLGAGNNGHADSQSGLFQSPKDIQQLSGGDVALLKGELWEGNENAGLVHRSPAISPDEKRLLLTLDFMS